jgi:hypothetical protein
LLGPRGREQIRAPRDNRDAGAGSGKRLGYRETKSEAAACNQGLAALHGELHGRFPSRWVLALGDAVQLKPPA